MTERTKLEIYEDILDTLPHCYGRWIKGSGGHQVWSNDCGRLATWLEKDALGVDWSGVCDNHRDNGPSFNREAPWAEYARELAETPGARSARLEVVVPPVEPGLR